MVADAFEKRSFFAASWSQFDECLQQLMKQGVMTKTFCIQVVVHFGDVTGFPEVHQAMYLVDQWSRRANKCFVTHTGILALIPLLQLHGTACTLFLFFFCLALHSAARNGFLLSRCLTASAGQKIITGRQCRI